MRYLGKKPAPSSQSFHMRGTVEAWTGNYTTPTTIFTKSFTPTVPGYWHLTATAISRIVEAAWGFNLYTLALNIADVDGQSVQYTAVQHHAQAAAYNGGAISTRFRLAANTAYSVSFQSLPNTGTWNYYQGGAYLNMHGIFVPA